MTRDDTRQRPNPRHPALRGVLALAAVAGPFAAHATLVHGGAREATLSRGLVALQVGTVVFLAARFLGARATRRAVPGGAAPVLAGLAALGFLLATAARPRTGVIAASATAHALLYSGLGLLFGTSLLPGREALVSRLARRVEPRCDRALMRYTRGVTWLWLGFAVAQLAVSAGLGMLAPLRAWSAFVNLLDLPLVALCFAGEYAVRRWRFRGRPMATLRQTVRAFAPRGGGALASLAAAGRAGPGAAT